MDLQGNYITNDIYLFDQTGRDKDGKIIGAMNPTGNLPSFMKEIEVNHLPFSKDMFQKKVKPYITGNAGAMGAAQTPTNGDGNKPG